MLCQRQVSNAGCAVWLLKGSRVQWGACEGLQDQYSDTGLASLTCRFRQSNSGASISILVRSSVCHRLSEAHLGRFSLCVLPSHSPRPLSL